MQKLLPTALCVAVSVACSEAVAPQESVEVAGAATEQVAPPTSFFDEVVQASPQVNDEPEVEVGSRAAGVQLARMTVSEATSLQPLNNTWQLDMQGILQVARNTQGADQTLLEALKELSPHVGAIKPYTDGRQLWLSTLPARGDGPPEFWVECTGWETVHGRKRSVPEGCHGVWELGAQSWVDVRTYAIGLIHMKQPELAVQGKPITWGGIMDIFVFLKERPNLCWLESGPTTNFFFGMKTDPANSCKPIPTELVEESRTVSAEIVSRSLRRKTQER